MKEGRRQPNHQIYLLASLNIWNASPMSLWPDKDSKFTLLQPGTSARKLNAHNGNDWCWSLNRALAAQAAKTHDQALTAASQSYSTPITITTAQPYCQWCFNLISIIMFNFIIYFFKQVSTRMLKQAVFRCCWYRTITQTVKKKIPFGHVGIRMIYTWINLSSSLSFSALFFSTDKSHALRDFVLRLKCRSSLKLSPI